MLTKENYATAACENCLFYCEDGKDYGFCCCRAPRPPQGACSIEPEEWSPYDCWPMVDVNCVCGRYEPA